MKKKLNKIGRVPMPQLVLSGAGALIGMFFVAFTKNGIIGKNRAEHGE